MWVIVLLACLHIGSCGATSVTPCEVLGDVLTFALFCLHPRHALASLTICTSVLKKPPLAAGDFGGRHGFIYYNRKEK